MSKIEIIPVEYGNSEFEETNIFPDGRKGEYRHIVFMMYLIKTEGKLILVDAGCDTMPGFDMHDYFGPVDALARVGVNADDITHLLVTHAHHDHIDGVRHFKNAEIFIQKDEYKNGKGYFEEGMNITTFDDEIKICDGVKMIRISGHSVGSCIVEIIDNDEKTVITGDETYLRECIEKRIPTANANSAENNLKFFDEYCGGNYRVLLCHDK